MTLLLVTFMTTPAFATSPAELISQFRAQHGESKVASDATLNSIAHEQAAAMAAKDTLDHDVAGAFTARVARAKAGRAAENIAYGHADFPSTLRQWINSSGHRRNLLLKAASKVGVAQVRSAGGRTYWAMVIAGDYDRPKPKAAPKPSKPDAKAGPAAASAGKPPATPTSAAKPKPAAKRDCTIRMLGMCF